MRNRILPIVSSTYYWNTVMGLIFLIIPLFSSAVSVTTQVTNATCNTVGKISTTVTGGVSPYSYLWSTGATTPILNNLNPGTYSVTVTDANNSTAVATATVGGPTPTITYTTIANGNWQNPAIWQGGNKPNPEN